MPSWATCIMLDQMRADISPPVMRAIGVPEITMFCQCDISQEEAIAAGQQATRRYAKRQYTWLNNQNPADWPRVTYDSSVDADHAASLLRI